MSDIFQRLKHEAWEANLMLPKHGLVLPMWGSVSGKDEETQLVAIRPNGVPYEQLLPEHMVVVNMDGDIIDGELKPSSDIDTHLELYRRFPSVGGVAHTHSAYAVAFAQAGRGIQCYGATHADCFYGEIPCTRSLRAGEIQEGYELNIGRAIAELFERRGIDPSVMPAALARKHGPFAWGESPGAAATNAVYLEEVAFMALHTEMLRMLGRPIFTPPWRAPRLMIDKHFFSFHSRGADYSQQ